MDKSFKNFNKGGLKAKLREMGTESEFDQAMEAVTEYQILTSLQGSDELVCECYPVSHKQIAQYLKEYRNQHKKLEEILDDLRMAQGCGTCLNKASQFITMVRNKSLHENTNSKDCFSTREGGQRMKR